MTTVAAHYAEHLAPIYLWMVGGDEAALSAGASEMQGLRPGPGLAVDLGAGFGMHAIPLARAGYRVVAIDSSRLLLAELRRLGAGLPIETHEADLLRLREFVPRDVRADLVICMGDTLTHLADLGTVRELARRIAACLAPGGQFAATFRDYSNPPHGEARFIPVRADDERVLTCFLEAHATHMQVHDLLHERVDGGWKTRVGSYRKLRLAPDAAAAAFADAGLRVALTGGPRGMVRLQADA